MKRYLLEIKDGDTPLVMMEFPIQDGVDDKPMRKLLRAMAKGARKDGFAAKIDVENSNRAAVSLDEEEPV